MWMYESVCTSSVCALTLTDAHMYIFRPLNESLNSSLWDQVSKKNYEAAAKCGCICSASQSTNFGARGCHKL